MKEIIEQVDQMLAMLEVRGNSVMILADARKALGQAYRLAAESEEKAGEKSEGGNGK